MLFMALSIKSAEADRLARELSDLTGESRTMAVTEALRERIERKKRSGGDDLDSLLDRIQDACGRARVLDGRSADEILGYDASGLPT